MAELVSFTPLSDNAAAPLIRRVPTPAGNEQGGTTRDLATIFYVPNLCQQVGWKSEAPSDIFCVTRWSELVSFMPLPDNAAAPLIRPTTAGSPFVGRPTEVPFRDRLCEASSRLLATYKR